MTSFAAWFAYIATFLLALSMASTTGSAKQLPPFLKTFSYDSPPLVTVNPVTESGLGWRYTASNGPNPKQNTLDKPWFFQDSLDSKSRQVFYDIEGIIYCSVIYANGSPSELHQRFMGNSK